MPTNAARLQELARHMPAVGEAAAKLISLEVKSGATLAPDFFPHVREFAARVPYPYAQLSTMRLVYDGSAGSAQCFRRRLGSLSG